MKKTYLFVLALLMGLHMHAQREIVIKYNDANKAPDLEKLENQKERIEAKERNLLKEEVKKINQKLEEGKITAAEADELKKNAAEKRAQNIKDQVEIIDANISLLSRNNGEGDDSGYYRDMDYLEKNIDTVSRKSKPTFLKTHQNLILGIGFSNAVGSGISVGDNYKVGGSRYFEIGYEWSTGLTKTNFLRINYGLSFQFNGLKAKNNQYFVKDGDQVVLEDFGQSLKKSKLRMDNVVIPVHFELGPTNATGYGSKFKIGLGGYAGLNMGTMQKLKYKADGKRIKVRNSFTSQTEGFVYGLSGYVGYDQYALYVKYDLNPIFKNNETDEHILAVGLRVMW